MGAGGMERQSSGCCNTKEPDAQRHCGENRGGDFIKEVLIEDGWPGGSRVIEHLGCEDTRSEVRCVEESLPADLSRQIYKFTVACGSSWGAYVPLREVQSKELPAALLDSKERGYDLALRIVRAVWLDGHEAAETLLRPELEKGRVHGFAVWANSAGVGEECAYHIDYAELHRRKAGVIHPPLLASTVHCSEVEEKDIVGGVFGVNTKGLEHYARFGHKGMLLHDKAGAAEADWNTDPHWVKIGYQFRRAILFGGALPHLATTLESMPAGMRRVVVGINVFDTIIGPGVEKAPVHSEAYKRSLAELHCLRPVTGDEQWGDDYALVPLPGRFAKVNTALQCFRCRGSPDGSKQLVQHGGQWYCSVRCLKSERREKCRQKKTTTETPVIVAH